MNTESLIGVFVIFVIGLMCNMIFLICMVRAFLSHSSKDKGYVRMVAKALGKENVVYDEWSFESGSKTIEEIYQWIDASGVFVFFISNSSLESSWVKDELTQAEQKIKSEQLRCFIPIVIDKEVKYFDKRIPSWIRENYNLKYTPKPSKSASIIRRSQIQMSWDASPIQKELDGVFVGREGLLKEINSRLYSYDQAVPRCVIASGLKSMGRSKLLRHSLRSYGVVRPEYQFPSIVLSPNNSIEDLIVLVYDLGYSSLPSSSVRNLIETSMSDKIELLIGLLTELNQSKEILMVEDNYVLVSQSGRMSKWFVDVLDGIQKDAGVILCVRSLSRLRDPNVVKNDTIFHVSVPELEKIEREGLFKKMLEIRGVVDELTRDNFFLIARQFKGFPEQIFYTVELLLTQGIQAVVEHPHLIVEYNTEKVSSLIKSYETDEMRVQVLVVLSGYSFISSEMLKVILGSDYLKASPILEELVASAFVEYVGVLKEYFRLNDVIRDYIQRSSFQLRSIYKDNLRSYVVEKMKRSNEKGGEESYGDASDYMISIQEALKNGLDIQVGMLIPTHFIMAMKDLYDERKYNMVVTLADRLLVNSASLDLKVKRDVRYRLCLSLARLRNEQRFFKELHPKENSDKLDDVSYNFLLGFYYRLAGSLDHAWKRFSDVLKYSPNHSKAKREMVQICILQEDYERGCDMAKEAYENDKTNPYNIQGYFVCLLRSPDKTGRESILPFLLTELESNKNVKANLMYILSSAQYRYFVEGKVENSITEVQRAVRLYPNKIYPYLVGLEILEYAGDEYIDELECFVKNIDMRFSAENDMSDIKVHYRYLLAKLKLAKLRGRVEEEQALRKEISLHYPTKKIE